MADTAEINETIIKFGYPDTLIAEYPHWVVLLRPAQITLGALVLGAKGPATAFSGLSGETFAELRAATGDIEGTLAEAFSFDRINYLMLMMVDPNVHFHVVPRYGAEKTFGDVTFPDLGWPGPPRLDQAPELAREVSIKLRDHLKECWAHRAEPG